MLEELKDLDAVHERGASRGHDVGASRRGGRVITDSGYWVFVLDCKAVSLAVRGNKKMIAWIGPAAVAAANFVKRCDLSTPGLIPRRWAGMRGWTGGPNRSRERTGSGRKSPSYRLGPPSRPRYRSLTGQPHPSPSGRYTRVRSGQSNRLQYSPRTQVTPGQSTSVLRSAVDSQAQSASSILVTRSTTKAPVNDPGLSCCVDLLRGLAPPAPASWRRSPMRRPSATVLA
jgi:hypothetical protein